MTLLKSHSLANTPKTIAPITLMISVLEDLFFTSLAILTNGFIEMTVIVAMLHEKEIAL